MATSVEIGARLKAARERAGLTQVQAADALGISSGSLAGYEQGSREAPEATLTTAAALYGTHPALLRYGQDIVRLAAAQFVASQLRRVVADVSATAAVIESEMAKKKALDSAMPTGPGGNDRKAKEG